MGGEWWATTVGECAPFLYGNSLPENRRRPGRVPIYGSKGIVGFHGELLVSGPAVIIGRKGSVGAVHYFPEPRWPIDTTFYVVDEDPARLRFKYYLLRSLGLKHMNAASAVLGLNRDAAQTRVIKVLPLSEQTAIVDYLDTQTGKIDSAIGADRRAIELLEEFRTCLIADVVTGKLDVREVAARLPEEPEEEESDPAQIDFDNEVEKAEGEEDFPAVEEVQDG